MRKIERSKKFIKGLSKYSNHGKELKKIKQYLGLLVSGESLPTNSHDHALQGRMKGLRAFSVGGDDRVVYRITPELVELVDIGGHDIYESEDIRLAKRYLESLGYNIYRKR